MGYKTYTCSNGKPCVGCEWLSIPYPIQLTRKSEKIADIFNEMAEQDGVQILPILGMKEPTHFRYKATTPFAPGAKGKIFAGLYAPHSHKIVETEACVSEDARLRPILNAVASIAEKLHISAYKETKGLGTLRHATVRSSAHSDDIMLTIVTNGKKIRHNDYFVDALTKLENGPTTIIQNINNENTNAILGNKNKVLYGPGFIEDEILGARFKIGPTSFYQTNPFQTEVLYTQAFEMADLKGGMTLLDAYCGCGTIGICAAKQTDGLKVIGIERVGEAVGLARQNAKKNDVIEACSFIKDDATEYMKKSIDKLSDIDVIILDPPRAGSTEEFLQAADNLTPEKIVYISCNPTSQARDIAYLRTLGWKIKKLQPVDMFPHTKHIENIALLTKN